jgi:hypothetical protein
MTTKNNPYGDDGGTRVGKPGTPKRDNTRGGGDGGNLGAGKESTGGLSERGNPADAANPAAASPRRKEDKGSGYGGTRGGPKTDAGQK